LKTWFDSWEHLIKKHGFGKAKEDLSDDSVEGEIVFFDGARNRILNFDEMALTLDGTMGNCGGQPTLVYSSNEIGTPITAVNESAYSATLICGSTAASDPLPPHFQLHSVAGADQQKLIQN